LNLDSKNSISQLLSSVREITKENKFLDLIKKNIIVLILIFLLVLGTLTSGTFLSLYNLQNIAINVSIFGILAIGQTLVLLTKQIDLSVGANMAFSLIAAIKITQILMSQFGVNIIQEANYVNSGMLTIIVFTIVVSNLIGLLNGIITVKAKVPPLITTLGMLYALRGFAYVLSKGHPLYFTYLQGFNWLGTKILFNVPVCFLFYLVIGIVGILILKYTKIGTKIYATGGNEKAAIYSGINSDLWRIIVYGVSGFCAGFATLIYSSRLESVEVAQATGYEFISVAIVVIGGTTLEGGRGRLFGTFLAAIILGVVINIITLMGLIVWYQNIIIGIIIISAVFAYIKGIRVKKRT